MPSIAVILILKNDGQKVLLVHTIHSRSEYEFLQAFDIILILLLENATRIELRSCLHEGNSELHPDETMCGRRDARGAAKLWDSVGIAFTGLRVM